MQTVFYFTFLALATFVWGYVFYKKDVHPQPKKILAQIFGFGFFAMLPVLAYKMIYQQWLPEISEFRIFRPLLDSPLLSGLAAFVFNLALLAAVLFVISGLLTLALTLFQHDTLANLRRALQEEPLGFGTVSLMIGALIYGEKMIETVWNTPVINTVLGTVLFLTIIEEYVKHLVVRLADDKKLKDIDDAITLSIMVGLAFAFVETIVYSLDLSDMSLVVYRSFLSLPVHVVASGIFGYYYGLTHFADRMIKAEGEAVACPRNWFRRLFHLKCSTYYCDKEITLGLLLATVFHALCNLLFQLNLTVFVVPVLVLGLLALSGLYKTSQHLFLPAPRKRPIS